MLAAAISPRSAHPGGAFRGRSRQPSSSALGQQHRVQLLSRPAYGSTCAGVCAAAMVRLLTHNMLASNVKARPMAPSRRPRRA